MYVICISYRIYFHIRIVCNQKSKDIFFCLEWYFYNNVCCADWFLSGVWFVKKTFETLAIFGEIKAVCSAESNWQFKGNERIMGTLLSWFFSYIYGHWLSCCCWLLFLSVAHVFQPLLWWSWQGCSRQPPFYIIFFSEVFFCITWLK